MKKFLLFIVLLIIICLVGAQFVVPKYVESLVESEINKSLQPTNQTVVIESTPAFKLVYGQADKVAGTLENVQLGKLNFSSFHYEANNLVINPVSLIISHEVDVLSLGPSYVEGIVLEDDLKKFLIQNTEGLQDANVRINNDRITLTGTINIMGSLKGQASLEGSLQLKDNILSFAPSRFTVSGLTISGITSQQLQPISIYDFNNFPVPVEAESVTVEKGEIHIKIRPVID